jgi:hypothetical protein
MTVQVGDMVQRDDARNRTLTALKGIALLLFSIQVAVAGLFADRFIWLLFAGVLLSIIGLIVAMLS